MAALELVKARLGILTAVRDGYLTAILAGIAREMEEVHGIALLESNPAQLMFLVDYACYRYQSAGEDKGMPRHLQWRLHNLMVKKNV